MGNGKWLMNDPVYEVGEPCRSACQGQTWYAEHEGKRYCVLHYPNEEKNADPDTQFQTAVRRKLERQDFNFAGVYFPAYLEDFASCRFDSRADFSKATFKGGASFAGAKFEGGVDFFGAEAFGEMNFAKVVFGTNGAGFTRTIFRKRASFSEAAFDGVAVFNEAYFMDGASFDESYFTEFAWFQSSRFPAGANFFAAVFSEGAIFEKARFRSQSHWFVGANFSHVTFEGEANFHSAVLSHATFEGDKFQRSADFTEATLDSTSGGKTDCRRATFKGELYFREAQFKEDTNFYRANFLDAVKFIGRGQTGNQEPSDVFAPDGHVSFTRARVEKPELFSFDTLRLRPSWLVGVDARKFDFTAVEWYGMPNGPEGGLSDEISRVRQKEQARFPHVLLEQACQKLAANAEENRQYPVANEFYYWSMDAARMSHWSFFKDKSWRDLLQREHWTATTTHF
jgi:uncharacterized protein YjbI with pentapeptide repeats